MLVVVLVVLSKNLDPLFIREDSCLSLVQVVLKFSVPGSNLEDVLLLLSHVLVEVGVFLSEDLDFVLKIVCYNFQCPQLGVVGG